MSLRARERFWLDKFLSPRYKRNVRSIFVLERLTMSKTAVLKRKPKSKPKAPGKRQRLPSTTSIERGKNS